MRLQRAVRGSVVLAVLLLCGVALCGCESLYKDPPPPDPNLYPTKYRAEVADLLLTEVNSARNVREAYITEPVLKSVNGSAPRYVSCVRYTAKGTDERYTPSGDKLVTFVAGHINQYIEASREQCGSAAYQRFPEAEARTR